jgi:hypothetical protein
MFKHIKDWGPPIGHTERMRRGFYAIGEKETETLVTGIVVAYIRDRAEQYKNDSGSKCALEELASAIGADEHMAAFRHGELDDLLKPTPDASGKAADDVR